jgi:hypothetical protein
MEYKESALSICTSADHQNPWATWYRYGFDCSSFRRDMSNRESSHMVGISIEVFDYRQDRWGETSAFRTWSGR